MFHSTFADQLRSAQNGKLPCLAIGGTSTSAVELPSSRKRSGRVHNDTSCIYFHWGYYIIDLIVNINFYGIIMALYIYCIYIYIYIRATPGLCPGVAAGV